MGMNTVIVTEGPADVAALRKYLNGRRLRNGYRFMPAGGASPAVSLARSVLATTPDSVALVLAGDSTSTEEIQRRRRYIVDALSEVAEGERFVVLLATPDLETTIRKGSPELQRLFEFLEQSAHART
jgi:hypothetical protein